MTEAERRMIEICAPLQPRWIESERCWVFVYDNGYDREVERHLSLEECEAAIRALATKTAP